MKITYSKYQTIHRWTRRNFTKSGVCENCKIEKRTEWSNKSGNYIMGDRRDWQELCKSCHYRYDVDILGMMSMKEKGRNGGLKKNPKKGFASLRPEKRKEIASRGGSKSKRGRAVKKV